MQNFEIFIWIKTIFQALVSNLNNYLIIQGFQRLELDGNIYIKWLDHFGFVIFTIYVDDWILINNTLTLIKKIKCTFQQEFEMLDDGKFDYTLSNAIIHNQQEGWTNLQRYLISLALFFCRWCFKIVPLSFKLLLAFHKCYIVSFLFYFSLLVVHFLCFVSNLGQET